MELGRGVLDVLWPPRCLVCEGDAWDGALTDARLKYGDVLRGIEFPKPRGGGGVQINYPFTFRTAP